MIRLCAPTDEVSDNFYEALDVLNEYGITLCELRGVLNKNILDLTEEEAKLCSKLLDAHNIKVWAISSPVGKTKADIPFNLFKDKVDKAIKMALIFKAPIIRVFSFFEAYDKRDIVIKYLTYAVNEAKKHHILISHENEKNAYGDTPERVLDLLDNIPGLVCNYDASNFIQSGVKSEHSLALLFPRCYYVHFKDGIRKGDDAEITPVGEGEANIHKLLTMIKDDKVLSIEHHLRFLNDGEKMETLKKDFKFLYKNTTEAFISAVKAARKELYLAGYIEGPINYFHKI